MELKKRAMKLLKQTQRNRSNASQGGQTALKAHVAVLHSETASTTQQPRGEHRGTIKDCKIAGATTWQGQGNHTFTTTLFVIFKDSFSKIYFLYFLLILRDLKNSWRNQSCKSSSKHIAFPQGLTKHIYIPLLSKRLKLAFSQR